MDTRLRSSWWLTPLFFLSLFGFSNTALAEYALNMTKGVTSISAEIHQLHMIIFWICVYWCARFFYHDLRTD